MKSIKIIIAFYLPVMLMACKEDEKVDHRLASVNVVHAAVDVTTVKVNNFGKTISWANLTGTDGSINYTGTTVNKIYSVYQPYLQYPFEVVSSPDTLRKVFKDGLDLVSKGTYSLYLTGRSPNFESVIVKEDIPYRTDSVAGVRFINLSPNSDPISVNITGNANGSEVASLAYKASTDFKAYPAKFVNLSYAFQVRNASTGALLASYTLATPRMLNVTLAFRGLVGTTGTTAPVITRVNNY